MRTQVAIIGAGPAGMFLAHLLHSHGIDCVVLERRDRDYVEGRVRAGVLEQITVDVMTWLGLDRGVHADGLVHGGINIALQGDLFRVDLAALTGGASVTVYGQQEVMRDLFTAAAQRAIPVIFDASDVMLHDLRGASHVTWNVRGETQRLDCDFVAGCDGFYGASRQAIPEGVLTAYERVYPFGWLGIMADVPPAHDELIYANHDRGFALASMRSPHRSRYYIQCDVNERLEEWPDERVWDEISIRLGPEVKIVRGPSFEKGIVPLRSFVVEPMRFGNLFLAGDAAHIVPPAGAKGLNLAVTDVVLLACSLMEFYRARDPRALDRYSPRALSRVWKAERFSWWFTGLMHRFAGMDPFSRKIQLAELDYLRDSPTFQKSLAQNYVGLPLDRNVIARVFGETAVHRC